MEVATTTRRRTIGALAPAVALVAGCVFGAEGDAALADPSPDFSRLFGHERTELSLEYLKETDGSLFLSLDVVADGYAIPVVVNLDKATVAIQHLEEARQRGFLSASLDQREVDVWKVRGIGSGAIELVDRAAFVSRLEELDAPTSICGAVVANTWVRLETADGLHPEGLLSVFQPRPADSAGGALGALRGPDCELEHAGRTCRTVASDGVCEAFSAWCDDGTSSCAGTCRRTVDAWESCECRLPAYVP